jgi:hypothetical protein
MMRGKVFAPLDKVGLASHIRHGNCGEGCYGHLVLRLMGCLVLFYTSRVICKGQLPVFSANKGPVHVRERGRQTPPGALSPAGEGDRSGR